MIVSFHPRVSGDLFLRLPRHPSALKGLAGTLATARAVLFPQTVSAGVFAATVGLCPNVFPDYRFRFGLSEGETYEGKHGAAALFERLRLPHPRTWRYASAAEFRERHWSRGEPLPECPFVLKGDRGGGGNWVFLIRQPEDLWRPLAAIERLGWPLVAQEFVPHGGRDCRGINDRRVVRDCRVVVVGERLFSYWRVQDDPAEFRSNVGRGARIDPASEPERLRAAEEAVRGLCRLSGLNLAAVDLLFGPSGGPLFGEINYCFGRKGLTNGPAYYELVAQAARDWLAGLGLENTSVRVREVS